jgi:hypothetical protein
VPASTHQEPQHTEGVQKPGRKEKKIIKKINKLSKQREKIIKKLNDMK